MKSQRGVATLLFILLAAVGLMAASAAALLAASGAQKLQYAEHVSTQSDMSAWAGVSVLSSAVAAMSPTAVLTPNSPVTFSGTQNGISATYVGLQNGFLVFRVTGTSSGAKTVLSVAFNPPTAPSAGSAGPASTLAAGQTLHGNTTITGSVKYAGSTPPSLLVIGGALTLSGTVTGLGTVCATGDLSVSSAIQVTTLCSNGNVTLTGGANATTVNAIGNVLLSGGAASTLGTINSNGTVTLSGGSATAGVVNSTGNVVVSGGNARATTVNTQGLINWTSSATATALNANGAVTYSTSAATAATNINAIGNVTLSAAQNVNTDGTTTLNGYYGQGITGSLQGQGILSGTSWGTYGGAVVGAGKVGSAVTPFPASVHVTVTPGLTVPIAAVTIPALPVFGQPAITVDAYALKSQANFAFTGMDANGNPIVTVNSINGVTDGVYVIANKVGGLANYLCTHATGTTCDTPLLQVCRGYSNQNACFTNQTGAWTIQGTTMLPGVVWFQGDLTVGSGTWVNSFLATGNITTSGSVIVYAPNYPTSAFTCGGAADTTHSIPALSVNGMSGTNYPTQLCSGAPLALNGGAIGNIALLAGGYSGSTFAGGNINLATSISVYGSVLAGQFLSTGGSTTSAGSIYSGAQGGTATGGNSQGGSTTIITSTGSPAYSPTAVPCMANCAVVTPSVTNNIVWVAPI